MDRIITIRRCAELSALQIEVSRSLTRSILLLLGREERRQVLNTRLHLSLLVSLRCGKSRLLVGNLGSLRLRGTELQCLVIRSLRRQISLLNDLLVSKVGSLRLTGAELGGLITCSLISQIGCLRLSSAELTSLIDRLLIRQINRLNGCLVCSLSSLRLCCTELQRLVIRGLRSKARLLTSLLIGHLSSKPLTSAEALNPKSSLQVLSTRCLISCLLRIELRQT